MCVPCAFTIVLIYMHVTDENPRRNGKFDGRYTLVHCPFSHMYIIICSLYATLCIIWRILSGDISIVLGYLGIFTSVSLIFSVPQCNDKT